MNDFQWYRKQAKHFHEQAEIERAATRFHEDDPETITRIEHIAERYERKADEYMELAHEMVRPDVWWWHS